MNSAYSQTCNSKVIWGRNSIRLLSHNVETMQSTYFHVTSIIFHAILETQEIEWVSERVRITLKMACSLILANVFGFQFSKMKVTAWYWNCSKGKRGEPHTHSRSTKIGQAEWQSIVMIGPTIATTFFLYKCVMKLSHIYSLHIEFDEGTKKVWI